MKHAKKIIAVLLAATMVLGLVACGDSKKTDDTETNGTTVEQTADGETDAEAEGEGQDEENIEVSDEPVELTTSEQILVDMYDASPMDFPVMTWAIDVTDAEQVKSYAGLENGDKVVSIAVSEPAMSSQAYSTVLVEVKDEADVQAVADEMKAGVNPKKWVCVEADDMDVVIEGKYVCLVMISSEFKESATAKDLTKLCVDIINGEDVKADSAATVEGTETNADDPAETDTNAETTPEATPAE